MEHSRHAIKQLEFVLACQIEKKKKEACRFLTEVHIAPVTPGGETMTSVNEEKASGSSREKSGDGDGF